MSLTLDELTASMTPDEIKGWIYTVLATMGTRTTTWKPGAVARTIIAGCSIVLSAFSVLMASIAKSGWLELAEGDWLTLVAYHVFGVTRDRATFAPGTFTINNAGGFTADFDPGDFLVRNTSISANGKTYRNTQAFHLDALQTGLVITIEALEAGSASSAGPGDINALESAIVGVTGSNAEAVTGLDEESDPSLRLRCLEKRSTYSPNGPRDAYAYVAKTARRTDGGSAGVTRVKVSRSSVNGNVTVTVANPSGVVPGTVGDPTTDLGAVDWAIKQTVVPDGVTETTQSATPVVIPVTYALWIYSSANLTSAQVQDLVLAKLQSFMATQPIGGNVIGIGAAGRVFGDAIRTAIGAVRPEVFHVVVSAPAGDVVLSSDEVPLLGTVTCLGINTVNS